MKNLKTILLLFLANSISGVAQGISLIAIPWYFAQTDDMQSFGIIYIVVTIISLFWVPYGGTLIDKYSRKSIFLWLTAICGSIILIVAGYGYYQGVLPAFLVAMVFIVTFLNFNIHYPNLYAFLQEISDKKDYGKITSYVEIQGQTTSMLAGAFAAMLLEGTKNEHLIIFGFNINLGFDIEKWSIHEIFLMDGITYFVSFLTIMLIRYKPIERLQIITDPLIVQIKDGFLYLKQNMAVFIFGLASYSVFVAVLIEGFYLGVQYVSNHLDADSAVYASSTMYYAIGAILAGSFIRRLFGKISTPSAVIILSFMTTIIFLVLYLTSSEIIFYSMLFLLGVSNAGTRVMRTTYLFHHISNDYFGRANGILFLSNIIFRIFFLSIFTLGFFQKDNNVIYAFLIMAAFLLISSIILIVNKKYLKKD